MRLLVDSAASSWSSAPAGRSAPAGPPGLSASARPVSVRHDGQRPA
ncbi:hypothetical protein L083_3481 [Actinoplanes sp. N902-109]|nr:hypothetical protein L083_3481 [Actinoplanes sp. N902-109]